MTALLKTTQIQEPSSSAVNLTLGSGGGVTVDSTGVSISGSSSGTTTLVASATASGTVTLPAGTGTAVVNGLSSPLVQGTAVASTSGTAIAYTNLPSWVRRITLMLTGVSTSGTSNIIVQLGTGATPTYTTSGYIGSVNIQTGGTSTNFSSGFMINNSTGAADVFNGQIVINSFGSNTWVESGMLGLSNAAGARYSAGYVPLAAVLTAVQLTTVGGTDTFDAGSINILYE